MSGTTPSLTVQLRHALRVVGETAQHRRQPFLEEIAVGVVAAVVDRPRACGPVPVKSSTSLPPSSPDWSG
jgi:hypothetical protein